MLGALTQTLSRQKSLLHTVPSRPGAVFHLHDTHTPDAKTALCAGGYIVTFTQKTSNQNTLFMFTYQSTRGQESIPASTVLMPKLAALQSHLPTSKKHAPVLTHSLHTPWYLAILFLGNQLSVGSSHTYI